MKIDQFIASILHVSLSFLCKLTGRSNYFFAIAVVIFSELVTTLYYFYKYSIGKFDALDGLVWLAIFMAFIMLILLFRKDQQNLESGSDAKLKSEFNGDGWIVIRLGLGTINLFFLITDLLNSDKFHALVDLSWLLYSVSIYFAADTIPRGKGWIRQKAETLAKAVKNIKVPSPNALPPPVPG